MDSFFDTYVEPPLKKSVDETSLKLWLAGGVSVLATRPYDDSIRVQYQESPPFSREASHVGDLLGSGLASGLVIGTQWLLDDKSEAIHHLSAFTFATTTTFVLKYSFRRTRPNNSDERVSFPSGHTTAAFASATALTYEYGWKAAAIAYPLAVFTGLSRIRDDAHWGSDVVAGAFVGAIWARATYEPNQSSRGVDLQNFIPVVDSKNNFAVQFVYTY